MLPLTSVISTFSLLTPPPTTKFVFVVDEKLSAPPLTLKEIGVLTKAEQIKNLGEMLSFGIPPTLTELNRLTEKVENELATDHRARIELMLKGCVAIREKASNSKSNTEN